VAAYDAPFPDQSYVAGAREFPMLVPTRPDDPASEANRAAWQVLRRLEKPMLCAFSDGDPITRGADRYFLENVPGTRGIVPVTIVGASHFLQEDRPDDLAAAILTFLANAHLNA
jgi:haloalkane dehalogenase